MTLAPPYFTPESLAGGLGIAAVVAALRAGYLHRRSSRVHRWHAVDGKITWSMIAEKSSWFKVSSEERLGGGDDTVYRPDIRYTYVIGQHQHEGVLVYFGSRAWHRSDDNARLVVDRYPPGTAVKVYVNPTNVKEAVLESGKNPEVRRVLLILVGCVAGAVLVLLFRYAAS